MFLLFTIVPVLELALLVWLTTETNLLTTAVIVLTTGVVGAALAKWQGFRVWTAIRTELAAGRMPAQAMVDAAMIVVAGSLLLTPGLLTDVVGFLLLVPPARAVLRRRLTDYFRRRVELRVQNFNARARGAAGQGDIIDAEFRRADAPPIEDRP